MSGNNEQTSTKNNTSRKKYIIPLVAVVLVLILSNIMVTLAFFTDRATGESIITFGSVGTSAYILDGQTKLNTITLDSNELISGQVTTKDLHIDVTGKNDCYVRVKTEFQIAADGSTYVAANDLVSITLDINGNSNWVLSDGRYYYKSPLNGTTSQGGAGSVNVDLVITVSDTFGSSNLDNSTIYKNKAYKVIVLVESCQSEGTSLGSGNSFNPGNWVSN